MGFFKGMSFPLASITVYNSVVFGFFSNTQRLISKYRYGDGRHPCGMLDLTVASMLTGLMSVSLGAPVDLVKIRLQMQTQTVLAGKSGLMFDLGFLFSLRAEERTRMYCCCCCFRTFSLVFWHRVDLVAVPASPILPQMVLFSPLLFSKT